MKKRNLKTYPQKYSFLFILIVFFFYLLQCACSNTKTNSSGNDLNTENFELFYNQFKEDSIFQLERIKFPLHGKYMDDERAGQQTDNFIWTKENWKILYTNVSLNPEIYTTNRITKRNKMLIITTSIEGNFNFEETYELINSKWYLVYLVDVFL